MPARAVPGAEDPRDGFCSIQSKAINSPWSRRQLLRVDSFHLAQPLLPDGAVRRSESGVVSQEFDQARTFPKSLEFVEHSGSFLGEDRDEDRAAPVSCLTPIVTLGREGRAAGADLPNVLALISGRSRWTIGRRRETPARILRRTWAWIFSWAAIASQERGMLDPSGLLGQRPWWRFPPRESRACGGA